MPEPIVESLEDLGERPFAFYPAILNTEHNEWVLRQVNWSEIHVVNPKTGMELWVPRRYVGEFSSVDDPIIILGLRKELEYKAGTVWPRERQLFSMQKPKPLYHPRSASAEVQAPHGTGRMAEGPEKKVGRLVVTALAISVVLMITVVAIVMRPVSYKGIEQLALQLTGEDDYNSIVRKLGSPTDDRWMANAGEMQYRALGYKDKQYTLILMGTDRKAVRYVGAMDKAWRPVHSISLRGGGDTQAMLRRLPKF